MRRLEGRTVVVTGAASGIGLATAGRFAAEGAAVLIADLDGGKAEAEAARLAGGGARVVGIACDVASESDVERACRVALDRLGGLDTVVNNAGLMTFKPLAGLGRGDWLKVLEVDLLGAFYFTRQLLTMATRPGSVVNIASVHAVETTPDVAPYAAAKAALLSLTRSTAIEGKAKGIRANAILPGAVDTPMLWTNPNVRSGVEVIDRDAVGKPEDIAAAAVFLASDDALFLTGAALAVDGGRLARL